MARIRNPCQHGGCMTAGLRVAAAHRRPAGKTNRAHGNSTQMTSPEGIGKPEVRSQRGRKAAARTLHLAVLAARTTEQH